jgi:hypothetical protein
MTKDKFDMDAETVKLDLDVLISVAAKASRNALDLMQRTEGRATELFNRSDFNSEEEFTHHRDHHRAFWSEKTAEYALEWAEANKAYHHLVQAKNREQTILLKGE